MSNKVWVTWKWAAGEDPLVDKVIDLDNNADVADLRRLFVTQQQLQVSPGTLSVSKTDGGEKLKAGDPLQPYFVLPPGSAGLAGPGQDDDTALFVTFQQQPKGELRCCFCILVFKCCFEYGNVFLSYSWCSRSFSLFFY